MFCLFNFRVNVMLILPKTLKISFSIYEACTLQGALVEFDGESMSPCYFNLIFWKNSSQSQNIILLDCVSKVQAKFITLLPGSLFRKRPGNC